MSQNGAPAVCHLPRLGLLPPRGRHWSGSWLLPGSCHVSTPQSGSAVGPDTASAGRRSEWGRPSSADSASLGFLGRPAGPGSLNLQCASFSGRAYRAHWPAYLPPLYGALVSRGATCYMYGPSPAYSKKSWNSAESTGLCTAPPVHNAAPAGFPPRVRHEDGARNCKPYENITQSITKILPTPSTGARAVSPASSLFSPSPPAAGARALSPASAPPVLSTAGARADSPACLKTPQEAKEGPR